ncbi:MAG TPA: translation initiation factor IF-2 N-terminal domain-containing protein, partial [Pyrinomonadaceae bacterium]|nr:translation initiation factor IF-2 N-terminal domain-containing protein [Pyrinomonadaceae bacterium]
MTVQSKVRIYDLAKELKLESKRLIEEVRREGVDVSVPSNTVSKELAEKIRNKYFPKKEAVAPRAIRVVKKAHAPAVETAPDETPEDIHVSVAPPTAQTEQTPPVALNQNGADASAAAPAVDQSTSAAAKPAVARLVKKPLTPAARVEQPTQQQQQQGAAATGLEVPAPTEQSITGAPVSDTTTAHEDAPGPVQLGANETAQVSAPVEQLGEAPLSPVASGATAPAPPPASPSKQVKVLRLNASALNEGIKPGERVNAPAPPPSAQPTPRERDRRGREAERARGGAQRATGTPGESANPQTVYTPPADARRPRSRSGQRATGTPGESANPQTVYTP